MRGNNLLLNNVSTIVLQTLVTIFKFVKEKKITGIYIIFFYYSEGKLNLFK